MQASAAAVSYAEAMQVSAAELLSRCVLSPASRTSTDGALTSGGPYHPTAGAADRNTDADVPAEGEAREGPVPGGQQPAGAQVWGSGAVVVGAGDGLLAHQLPGNLPAPLYSPEALQLWLLQCCQQVSRTHIYYQNYYALLFQYRSAEPSCVGPARARQHDHNFVVCPATLKVVLVEVVRDVMS